MAVSGERIRQLRKEAGLTQEALGKKLGVIKQTVSSWENGVSEPNSEILSNMASIFDIPIGYLYGDTSTGIDYKNYQMDTPQFTFEFKMKIRDLLAEKRYPKTVLQRCLILIKKKLTLTYMATGCHPLRI